MRRALLALFVGALVVAAGCAGSPTNTTTAPNATNDTTTTAPAMPPGVAASGVTDAAALLDAHAAALADASYTLESVRTETFADGTRRQRVEETTAFAAGRTDYRTAYVVRGSIPSRYGPSDATARYWSDGTVALRALTVDGNTTYERTGRPQSFHEDYYDRLYVLFSVINTTTVGPVGEGGQTYYRVEATNATYPADLATIETARNASLVEFTALVAPSGVVHSYHLVYEVQVDGRTLRVEERVEFTAIGATTVRKPDWVPEATNATA